MREYSMRTHRRKNHQRWLNAFCRAVNKNIAEDNLWRGRFVVEQVCTRMEWFEDNSGGLMYCHLRFRDKKTGKTEDWYTDCLEAQWHIFFHMNDFIINTCKVWENEKPNEDTEDYTKWK